MILHFLQVAWAHVRCDWYLLTRGMWRGQCKYTDNLTQNVTEDAWRHADEQMMRCLAELCERGEDKRP